LYISEVAFSASCVSPFVAKPSGAVVERSRRQFAKLKLGKQAVAKPDIAAFPTAGCCKREIF